MKHLSPQDTIDEFWTKFNAKSPGKTSVILPLNSYAKKIGEDTRGIVTAQPAVESYNEAAEICKLKVEKIAKECRRVNQKYRDPHFDIEFDLKWGRRDCLENLEIPNRKKTQFKPQSVKRVGDIFEKPSFFISSPSADDIRQGQDGDCWLLAALCTLGNKPGLIQKVCVASDEEVGVYGFVFFRDCQWISEIIDDKLFLTRPDYDESILERVLWEDRERGVTSEDEYRKAYQTGSGALYFAQCANPNETWLPLLEKAYAKAHGDFAAIEGGFTGEGIEDLTGGVTTELFTTDILDREHFWKNELLKVNEEFLFGCATGLFRGWGERKGIKEGHAYSVMKAVEIDSHRLVLLKNPWGKGEWTGPWSDGSSQWTPEWMEKLNHRFGNNGAFWISYDDLLRKYQTFDRTRLFTSDWKATHQWTSLKIPWSIGYHETKFSFTLNTSTAVVVVLTQLDSRYFKGLEGQYLFELSFRLHKAGVEDYIVRSHGNYCMRRSVSAELDLEAGEYHVLVKVKAIRDMTALPAEQVVRENCRERRDKLLRIGLAYDLAHAKGHWKESSEEKEGRERSESRKIAQERNEVRERLFKKKKRSKHYLVKQQRRERKKKQKEASKTKVVAEMEINSLCSCGVVHKSPKLPSSRAKSVEGPPVFSEIFDGNLTQTTSATVPDGCTECHRMSISSATGAGLVSPKSITNNSRADHNYDSDSAVSDITSGTVDDEIERSKVIPTPPKPDESTQPLPEEEEDEFERDPWNAVAVVGLRVYSKEGEANIRVLRPKTWEDGETCLDIDDSAADATMQIDDVGDLKASRRSSRRESIMGIKGRLGSVAV